MPRARIGRAGAAAGAALGLLVLMAGCAREPRPVAAPAPAAPRGERFTATAYSIEGETADGTQTREGIVAADPDVLPLGTRIRVHEAGPYSGEYVVRDTGRRVQGRTIDVYVPSDREAKEFGERSVRVEVLERGAGVARE